MMDQERAKRFGNYLRKLREEHGLSVRELARRSGMDDGALSRLEQGKVASPKPETLKALAKTLDTPLVVLFDEAGYTAACGGSCLTHHLRVCYGHLPDAAQRAIDVYVEKVMREHGVSRGEQCENRK